MYKKKKNAYQPQRLLYEEECCETPDNNKVQAFQAFFYVWISDSEAPQSEGQLIKIQHASIFLDKNFFYGLFYC